MYCNSQGEEVMPSSQVTKGQMSMINCSTLNWSISRGSFCSKKISPPVQTPEPGLD